MPRTRTRPPAWLAVLALFGAAARAEPPCATSPTPTTVCRADGAPPPAGAPPASPFAEATCAAPLAALQDYLATLPATCAADRDCVAHAVAPSACAPPVVLARAYDPLTDARLQALRQAALACLPVRTCEATAALPVCRDHRCADALRP